MIRKRRKKYSIFFLFHQNNRKKELEKKQKLLAEIEARQIEKDKMIKQEILERRNMIVEKAQANKWLAKDSTKTLTKVEQNMEVDTFNLHFSFY